MNTRQKIEARILTKAEWKKAYSKARELWLLESEQPGRCSYGPSYGSFGEIRKISDPYARKQRTQPAQPRDYRWIKQRDGWALPIIRALLNPAIRAAIADESKIQDETHKYLAAKGQADHIASESRSESGWQRRGGPDAWLDEMKFQDRAHARAMVRNHKFSDVNGYLRFDDIAVIGILPEIRAVL
jgi:hypothetical protein